MYVCIDSFTEGDQVLVVLDAYPTMCTTDRASSHFVVRYPNGLLHDHLPLRERDPFVLYLHCYYDFTTVVALAGPILPVTIFSQMRGCITSGPRSQGIRLLL